MWLYNDIDVNVMIRCECDDMIRIMCITIAIKRMFTSLEYVIIQHGIIPQIDMKLYHTNEDYVLTSKKFED